MIASFVDSNIWLYALVQKQPDNDMGKHEQALATIKPGMFMSEQVIAEVIVNLLRKTNTTETEISAYLHEYYTLYHVISPDLGMHLQAQNLRQHYCLSFWDSLIVAAALKAECEILYSEDMQHGLVVEQGLRIHNPFVDAHESKP